MIAPDLAQGRATACDPDVPKDNRRIGNAASYLWIFRAGEVCWRVRLLEVITALPQLIRTRAKESQPAPQLPQSLCDVL